MAKTRRSHYLDDETLAFIEDLRANGHAQNKSQAVRKALKTAIDHLDQHGPGALAPDQPRRYVDLKANDGKAHQSNQSSDSVGVDRSQGDAGSSSGNRRSVPNRNGGAGKSDSRPRNDASTANDKGAREAGNHSALKNFNPFT
jgi:Arc/MetJ-type ribon-helix-helix transcriptional regulator